MSVSSLRRSSAVPPPPPIPESSDVSFDDYAPSTPLPPPRFPFNPPGGGSQRRYSLLSQTSALSQAEAGVSSLPLSSDPALLLSSFPRPAQHSKPASEDVDDVFEESPASSSRVGGKANRGFSSVFGYGRAGFASRSAKENAPLPMHHHHHQQQQQLSSQFEQPGARTCFIVATGFFFFVLVFYFVYDKIVKQRQYV